MAFLEALSPTPAFVVGPSNGVLGWNGGRELVRPLGMFEWCGDEPRPALFLHPDARTV